MAAYRAVGPEASGETTTQTVKSPASTAIGDYLIAECMVGNGTLTPAMSGWTELGKGSNTTGETLVTTWFGKYATEAGEKSFTVTWGGTKVYNACQIAAFKEPHATEAIPAKVSKFQVNSTKSKSVKVPSATPPVTGCVSYISAGINQTGTGTPPTNWTERQDNTVGDYIATRDETPKEASGEQTITLSAERITITAQIIVQPVASGKALTEESADSTAPTETLTKGVGKTAADATAPTETLAKGVGKALADSTAPTEKLTAAIGKGAFAESSAPTEAWTLAPAKGKTLEDATKPTETLAKQIGLVFSDATAPTETVETGGTAKAAGTTDSPSTRVRIRELPRLPLNHEAETPSGRFYRWAKDEPRPENVPSGFGFATSMPGGFDTENVTLPRKPGVDYSDLERLTTLRARGAGGEIASEMRLSKAPRTSGDQFSVGPEAQGWRAHLEDDPTAAEIYRDIDLSGWAGPSRARQIALSTALFPPTGSSEVVSDVSSGLPALRLFVEGTWTEPYIPVAEAWYDAGSSAKVSSAYYDFVSVVDTNFRLFWLSSAVDSATEETSGDLYTTTSGTGTAAPTARRFFLFQWDYNATNSGIAGYQFYIDLRRLAVYGNHGLTLQGTEPNAGFLASDVIANAISRWAPLLNFSTGSTGTIRPTAFVIPHLSFKDRTTVQAMIDATNAYELRPYAVWEDRTFHYHQWGDRGRKWRARVAPTQLAETGPTVERLRNGVIVTWRDVDGSTRWAGPIGSGCDAEDESLEDRDPENPANQRGLKMYGQPIDIGVSVESEAIRVGALNLARFQETDTSGEAQIVGTCTDDRGIERPAWQMRAGDTIVFVDAFDTRERRIIRTSYNEDTYTNTITLDAPPQGTPDLLAQMGASISDLGL